METRRRAKAVLAAVLRTLGYPTQRPRRPDLPENVGRRWTQQQDRSLAAGWEAGLPALDLALEHRRTVKSVRARLRKLGLLRD